MADVKQFSSILEGFNIKILETDHRVGVGEWILMVHPSVPHRQVAIVVLENELDPETYLWGLLKSVIDVFIDEHVNYIRNPPVTIKIID